MTLTTNESLRIEARAMDIAEAHEIAAQHRLQAQEDSVFEKSRQKQLTQEGRRDIGSRVLNAIDTEALADAAYRTSVTAGEEFVKADGAELYELAKELDETVYAHPIPVEAVPTAAEHIDVTVA